MKENQLLKETNELLNLLLDMYADILSEHVIEKHPKIKDRKIKNQIRQLEKQLNE